MKNLCSTLLFFLMLSANQSFAQRLEIMIVGSSHDNPPGYDDFDKIIDRLKIFKPDMVFGEYVPDREASVMDSKRANAEYQAYVLCQTGKANMDSLQKAGLYRPASEYVNIFFPLIYILGQQKLYPMDCQRYDREWSAQWALADAAFKALAGKAVEDSTSAEAKTYYAIKQSAALTAQDKKMMDPSNYVNMAHERYSELIDSWNFYGGSRFYGYPGFPDDYVKGMYKQWTLRNEAMCVNILKQARTMKARRIIVGVGAAHRQIMEQILSRDPEVKIISYLDFPYL